MGKSKKIKKRLEDLKPPPEEVKKIVKRTFGTSHWKPPKKKGERR